MNEIEFCITTSTNQQQINAKVIPWCKAPIETAQEKMC